MGLVTALLLRGAGGGGGGSGGGGAYVPPKDVNFYDYDGTRLYSYSLSELPLTELPAAPDHSTHEVPLTFQQWTHTLEQVNTCTDKLDVGATLIPTDGKTHLIINIAAEGRMSVPLYIQQTIANGVTIDWGDGSATQTLAGTGKVNTTHTYAAIGRYDVTLAVADGCVLGFGMNSGGYCVLAPTGTAGTVYSNMLKSAYIGNNVQNVNMYTFNKCYSLASVVIPQSVTSVGSTAFAECNTLSSVVIPQSVTSVGSTAFHKCYSLASVVIPQSVTSLVSNSFADCCALSSVVIPQSVMTIGGSFNSCFSLAFVAIPQSVTTIDAWSFSGCYGVAIYDFSACTAVPTLAATSAFSNIPADCIMKIPSALFDEWSTATNWSTYASRMVAV